MSGFCTPHSCNMAGPSWLSCIESVPNSEANLYTARYRWDCRQCPHLRGVPYSECPLQRGSTVLGKTHTTPLAHNYNTHFWPMYVSVCNKTHNVLSTLSSAFASFSLSLLLSSFLSCFASFLRSSLEEDGARRLVCVTIFPLNRCAMVTDTIVGRVTCPKQRL